MGNRHSLAKKKYWAGKTKEQKSKIMSERAKKQWAKKSKAVRLARSKMMNKRKADLSTA